MTAPAVGAAEQTIRLAVVVSHPIQYFCPQYSSWARLKAVGVRVFFASKQGLERYHDAGFDASFRWHGLALDFPHEFLAGADKRPVTARIDAPALEDRLADFGPHCVVIYGYGQPLQRRAARWVRREGVPLLMMTDSELRSKRSWPKRAVKALVLPALLRGVDRFLTIGDANEEYLRRYGVAEERFVRCPYPIDAASLDETLKTRGQAREAVRRQHGIPDGHLVVLMVGKLVAHKRQRDLIDFSNHLHGSRKDVTVVLAGSGEDEPQLRGMARTLGPGGVVFAGFLQPRDLARYLCTADVYAHCSEVEPYGVAVSEAVYAGLPVVLSHRCGCHGPTADVRPGLNGSVYHCGEVRALTSALTRILDSRERREAMALASRRIGRANQRLAHGEGLLQAFDSLGLAAGGQPARGLAAG